jgi:transposase
MLPVNNAAQVFIATGVTDMRKSINGLSIIVEEELELNPLSGYMFAFCNRKRDIVKILYWDRNGFCLWHKRLEKDRFKWPEKAGDVCKIHTRELAWLLDGLSLEQEQAHRSIVYESVL